MILDTLKNAALYHAVNPRFAAAFDFLQKTDLSTLVPGRNEIDGDELYVMLNNNGTGGGHGSGPLEIHRNCIDIHLTLEGTDEIGWKALENCADVKTEYQEDGDYALFNDAPDFYSTVPPGTFAIYFPQDAHCPMAGQGAVKKLVFKVAV